VEQAPANVLDRAAALERLGFEKELFEELVQSLVDRSRTMLAEIDAALAGGDTVPVEALCHSIKGAAATLEANALAAAAHRLELLAHSGDLVGAREASHELVAALDALAGELALS